MHLAEQPMTSWMNLLTSRTHKFAASAVSIWGIKFFHVTTLKTRVGRRITLGYFVTSLCCAPHQNCGTLCALADKWCCCVVLFEPKTTGTVNCGDAERFDLCGMRGFHIGLRAVGFLGQREILIPTSTDNRASPM